MSRFEEIARRASGRENSRLATKLSQFREGRIFPCFGQRLAPFKKANSPISEEDLDRYEVFHDMITEGTTHSHYLSHVDVAQFYVRLLFDGNHIASVGFDALEGHILITDIHGVPGKERDEHGNRIRPDGIQGMKWERGLVSYIVGMAKKYGVGATRVLSIDNHPANFDFGAHLDYQSGKLLYDVTAKRTGHRKDSADGNYTQVLTPEVPIRIAA